jgi:hypothetical protein
MRLMWAMPLIRPEGWDSPVEPILMWTESGEVAKKGG